MSEPNTWQQVVSLAAEWDEQAKMIEDLGEDAEGGEVANKRVAATLRTCAAGLRYRANTSR